MKNSVLRLLAGVVFVLAAPIQNAFALVDVADHPKLEPMAVHSTTTQNIVDALASRHYVSTILDDQLSSRIYDTYITDLDPSKSYFLASDIAEFEAYRYEMDNALNKGDLSPAFTIFNRYQDRVLTRFEQVLALLDTGLDQFDFTVDESLEIDRKKAPWASNAAELDDLWRKRVKDAVLNLRLTEKPTADIQELLIKRYNNRLLRTRQTNSEDVYQLYMNSFTKTYDPHTQYFSPRTSENFDINMSLSLEGIGAVLQLEDEYTKVVSLVPAGPADKTGQLKPNDKILGVGQGAVGEMVDVIGWRLDEVVQLIRGKKDTVVRLSVLPASSADNTKARIINITRNKVELEEQSAKSEVIEIEQFGHTQKIGIVDIPTFYVDFKALQKGDRDFKSTTTDVTRLIEELKLQEVDGIVIDLRDNGGGSLQEAKTLTGIFIDRGPTVQIRSKSNRVDILDDIDSRVVYNGPLAVLVNRLSASASEIFAGAIQDYERGIVIGTQTFGKGTVQSLLPLNRGQLKLTQAKFYRISGESTQHKGILPDVAYPSTYDPDAIGESTLDQPLPWDKIQPANYRVKSNIHPLLPELRALHEQRTANDADFNYLREAFAYRKASNDIDFVSLNEASRIAEKNTREQFWVALENQKRLAHGLAAITSLDELNPESDTLASAEAPEGLEAAEGFENSSGAAGGAPNGATGGAIVPQANATGESVKGSEMATAATPVLPVAPVPAKAAEPELPDPYLVESGHILLDLIQLSERTAAEQLGKAQTPN